MRYEFNIRPEPFQGYTQFDELELFDTELSDEWQGEVIQNVEYTKWVQRSLNQIMGLNLAVDGDAGTQTRSAIRSFQQLVGLTVDGKVGPMTEAQLITLSFSLPPSAPGPAVTPTPATPAATNPRAFIVGGAALTPPAALSVRNFFDPSVHRFTGPSRRGRTINEFVIHETVTRSVASTVSVLKARKLSVHMILGPDGEITQHGDLADDRMAHAGSSHNGLSVGVEVVNPYYPTQLKPGLPWTQTIKAGWAHRGTYVLPTPAQAEAVAQLTSWITSPAAAGLAIPRTWIGLSRTASGNKLAMNRVTGAGSSSPGIYAHTYFGHADGSWLVLYSYLRLQAGMTPSAAYAEAARLGTTKSNSVPVP